MASLSSMINSALTGADAKTPGTDALRRLASIASAQSSAPRSRPGPSSPAAAASSSAGGDAAQSWAASFTAPLKAMGKALPQRLKDEFNGAVDEIKTGLEKIGNVPGLRQIKQAGQFVGGKLKQVNAAYDQFLQGRYGRVGQAIKYSGFGADMLAMSKGLVIPGMSIMGSLPALGLAEGALQGGNLLRWLGSKLWGGGSAAGSTADVADTEAPRGGPQVVRVGGKTFPRRKQLKEAGGRWDRDSKSWLVPAENVDELKRELTGDGKRLGALKRLTFSEAFEAPESFNAPFGRGRRGGSGRGPAAPSSGLDALLGGLAARGEGALGLGRHLLGRAALPAAAGAGAGFAAYASLGYLQRGLNIAGDPTLTDQQRTRAYWETMPFGIGAVSRRFNDANDAARGFPGLRIQQQQNHTVQMAGIEAEGRRRAALDPLAFQAQAAEARAAGLRTLAPLQMGPTARGTSAEAVAYREQQRRLPFVEALRMAEAEERGAAGSARQSAAAAAAAQARLGPARQRVAALDQQIAGLERNRDMSFGEQQVRIEERLQRIAEQRAQAANELATLERAITNNQGEQLNYAERIAARQHARTDLRRVDLQNLQIREQSHLATLDVAAAAMPHERAGMLHALRTLQQQGFEGTHPILREQAMRIAPDFVRGLGRQELEGSDFIRQLREIIPEQFLPGGLRAGQQQVNQLNEQVARDAREAAVGSAERMGRIFRDAFEAQSRHMEGMVQRAIDEMRDNLSFGNVQRRPGGAN